MPQSGRPILPSWEERASFEHAQGMIMELTGLSAIAAHETIENHATLHLSSRAAAVAAILAQAQRYHT
ncbi:ANTAR domain-containing protein [Rhodococcus sp. OK302]|uniref:ANTAR domain-containing protein n=1 Tax=Rhodococcus sp. OK302 TaxID=1882769 RepID=UPI000B9F49C9|nr:ANTAR domain-containing protein [Rhodococcus sp. OK302]OYD61157.1 ANTAR domain-containing protein [Rhodococcus sp. OK302]